MQPKLNVSGPRRSLSVTYLLRHGETASNSVGQYAGRGTEPLLASGREQMARLARRLRGARIEAVWTSTVRRAVESAEILACELGLPVKLESRLDEMAMGPWEGLTEAEVAAQYPEAFRLWLQRPDRLQLDGRETLSQLARRVVPVLKSAATGPGPKLLVTHVAPIRVVTLETLGLPMRLYKSVKVGNADCFLVEYERGEVKRLGASTSVRLELSVSGVAFANGKEMDD